MVKGDWFPQQSFCFFFRRTKVVLCSEGQMAMCFFPNGKEESQPRIKTNDRACVVAALLRTYRRKDMRGEKGKKKSERGVSESWIRQSCLFVRSWSCNKFWRLFYATTTYDTTRKVYCRLSSIPHSSPTIALQIVLFMEDRNAKKDGC